MKLRLARKIGNTPRAGRPVRRVTMARAWRRTKCWRLMKQWPEWRRYGGQRPLKYCPSYECGWTDLIKTGRCKGCGKLWKPNVAAYEARMREERIQNERELGAIVARELGQRKHDVERKEG